MVAFIKVPLHLYIAYYFIGHPFSCFIISLLSALCLLISSITPFFSRPFFPFSICSSWMVSHQRSDRYEPVGGGMSGFDRSYDGRDQPSFAIV